MSSSKISSSLMAQIPKFDGKNYKTWNEQMMALFKIEDVVAYVDNASIKPSPSAAADVIKALRLMMAKSKVCYILWLLQNYISL